MDKWAVVSAIGGAVSALAALVAVWQAATIFRDQVASRRPYVRLVEPKMVETGKVHPLEMRIGIENIGQTPATNLKGYIYIFGGPEVGEPFFSEAFSVSNDLPPQQKSVWRKEVTRLNPDMPIHWLVVLLDYQDVSERETYEQRFYLMWPGLKEGAGTASLFHATDEEKVELDKYIQSR